MSADIVPIPVFPHERLAEPERMALLRRAFEEIAPPYSVRPVPAVPGSPGRVLAWGQVAPWCHDQVVIRAENIDNYASIGRALQALLTAPDGAAEVFTQEKFLSAVMGVPVTYRGQEQMVPKVAFA